MSSPRQQAIHRGPRVGPASVCHLLHVAGPFVADAFLDEGWRRERFADISSRAGLYLLVDGDRRVIRFGQANRRLGVQARIEEHLARPYGVVVEHAWVVEVDELVDRATLSAMEGRCADLLGLRGTMGRCRWPSGASWWDLVGSRHRDLV